MTSLPNFRDSRACISSTEGTSAADEYGTNTKTEEQIIRYFIIF